MTRPAMALRAAAGLALTAAWLLWWAPAILLRLAQLAAARARFRLVMAWGDALKAAGRRDSAARLYERELARSRRRMAALAVRQRG